MTRILLWIEPHPIRGRYDEFFEHAVFLAEALLLDESELSFALFSNAVVLERLRREYPAAAPHLVVPTDAESAWLQAQAGDWTEARKSAWLDVVAGRGATGAGHLAMARRVIAETAADAVVMWSDNGGLRRAAAEAGLPAFSCELGPTRAPFPQTFYIDPCGTNGLAAMRSFRLDAIAALLPDRAERLRQRSPATDADFARLRGLAAGTTPPHWAPEPPFALVPLQLADDLNTLLHAPYPDPRAFLMAVLPPLLESFGSVVVKGHPGVAGRPGNAVLQDAALDYAESLPGVSLAPDRLPADQQSWLLANAALVCALNSSVAFEALLLDRPVVLLGDAAFDLDGTLKRSPERLTEPADTKARALLRSANLGLFLHGMDANSAGAAIREAVARASAGTDAAGWTASALEMLDRPLATAGPVPVMPAASGERLEGYVETVEERQMTGAAVTARIAGWIRDPAADRPVRRVAIVSGETVLAETRIPSPRPDVARALRSRAVSLGFDLTLTCDPALWKAAVLRAEDAGGVGSAYAIVAGRLIAISEKRAGGCPPRPVAADRGRLGRLAVRVQRLRLRLGLLSDTPATSCR